MFLKKVDKNFVIYFTCRVKIKLSETMFDIFINEVSCHILLNIFELRKITL